MTPDRELIEKIGNILWGIFPPDAKTICYRGAFYPYDNQCSVKWSDKEGKMSGPDFGDDRRFAAMDDITGLAVQLQSVPPYSKEPFTQMQYTLDEHREIDIKFAYIPEWDSWPGVYMKGVSDFQEHEVEDSDFPKKDWLRCKARREKEPY